MAASSISTATSFGFEASDAWLELSVMIFFGFIRADIHFWMSAGSIRSSLEIWYQDGFDFHAGTVTLFENVPRSGAFWVTPITRPSSGVRSWQKLSWNLSCLIQRY